jgi:hypothetical protein
MSTLTQKSCPQTVHSTDPRWFPNNHEEKLLEFLESLILDLARNHASVTSADVRAWLSSVAAGTPKVGQLEELHVWQKKAALAIDFLEKFPDCQPAIDFLERFKEKFGYDFRL